MMHTSLWYYTTRELVPTDMLEVIKLAKNHKRGRLYADAADQGDVSTQRHQPFVNVVEAERPITTDLPETPVELLELHHHCSWSFDAEDPDPDTVDGIDVDRERCRVYVTAY